LRHCPLSGSYRQGDQSRRGVRGGHGRWRLRTLAFSPIVLAAKSRRKWDRHLSHHRIVCTDPKVRRRAGKVGIRDVRITSDD